MEKIVDSPGLTYDKKVSREETKKAREKRLTEALFGSAREPSGFGVPHGDTGAVLGVSFSRGAIGDEWRVTIRVETAVGERLVTFATMPTFVRAVGHLGAMLNGTRWLADKYAGAPKASGGGQAISFGLGALENDELQPSGE